MVAGPGGEQITVEMGSYGIGVSRLVGGIEASHDEAGIVWPESVAPFRAGSSTSPDDAAVSGACQKLYDGSGKASDAARRRD